jgi:diguanylate cyclase (GGDEF)-like protein/PAS domain S-box-containing protein
VVIANPAAERMLGLSLDQLQGRGSLDPRWRALHEDGSPFPGPDHPAMVVLRTGQPQHGVVMCIERPDGSRRWLRVNANPIRSGSNITGSVASFVDVTAERAREREQAAMLDNDLVGMVRLRNRVAVWSNAGMERLFGYATGELDGHASRCFYPSDAAYEALGQAAYPVLAAGGIYRAQQQLVRKDGSPVWVDLCGRMLSAETGESLWLLADISGLKAQQQQTQHLAQHDALTGLPNRLLLDDRVEQALLLAERDDGLLAVCYLDLDNFKPVNDAYGHAAGDQLLKAIAGRLTDAVRAHDTVCRLGGDEFVLLITRLGSAAELEPLLTRVLARLSEPVRLDAGCEVGVTATMGVAVYPVDARAQGPLLCLADQAMYRAKSAGRNRWLRWQPE